MNKLILFYLYFIQRLRSLDRIINYCCNRYSSRVFLVDSQTGKEISYSHFYRRARGMAEFLQKFKYRKHTVVCYLNSNTFSYYEIRTACHLTDLQFFALPLYLPCSDILYFIHCAEAQMLFYGNEYQDKGAIASMLEGITAINVDEEEYCEIFKQNTINSRHYASKEGIVTLNLSSGTTGRIPKIVCLSARNWIDSMYTYLRNSPREGKSIMRFMAIPPLYGASSTTFIPTLMAGAVNFLFRDKFIPERVVKYIRDYEITHLYITPSCLNLLYDYCTKKAVQLLTLKSIIIGTERCSAGRIKEFIDFFGPIIKVGYGMVEVLPPLTLLSPQDYYRQGKLNQRIMGSVGKVLKGVAITIQDENGNVLDKGQIGKIVVSAATISKGYLGNQNETEKKFKNKLFYSDDYGYIDTEGYLYVLGRKEEMFCDDPSIFAGMVEDSIYELSFVNMCAVVKLEKTVSVFLTLREHTVHEEVVSQVRKACACFDIAQDISYEVIIKEYLPLTPLGKLDKKKLAKEREASISPEGKT